MTQNPERGESPVMHYVCWVAWFIGSLLIAGSWFRVVSTNVGWIGFAMASIAALVSRRGESTADEEFVFLDSRLLREQDEQYVEVMLKFLQGACLSFDGVTLQLEDDNQLLCAIEVQSAELSEQEAGKFVDHVQDVCDFLSTQSTEFAAVINGRQTIAYLMYGPEPNSQVVCRCVDGRFEWPN